MGFFRDVLIPPHGMPEPSYWHEADEVGAAFFAVCLLPCALPPPHQPLRAPIMPRHPSHSVRCRATLCSGDF